MTSAVLFFGADTWVLMKKMIQRLEGSHVSFLRQFTRKQGTWWRVGSWRKVKAYAVLQGVGTHTLRKYVDRRQATVVEWVANRPIFGVCARETGYEGGGRLRVPW